MKKVFFILLAVSIFIFLASILINPAIIFLVKRQLNTIFKGSEVSIGSCRLNPARQLSFFDVSIKKKGGYDFLVKQVRAEYSLSSIFKSEILKFSLREAKIYINLPQKSIAEFSQYLNLGPKSVLLVKSLELSDFNLDLKAKDLNASGVFSIQVNLIEQIMDYLDIKIDALGIQGFNLSNFSLKAAQGSSEGYFGISQMKYDKLNISAIKSAVRLLGKELFLDGVSACALDGDIGGNLKFRIALDIDYGADLKFTNLDIARFINDFDLKEKFEMTGRLGGDLTLKGKGTDIEILNGRLSSLESGGMLMIKDTKFLENMARNINQSLDLLVENFKNYHYNIATIKLFLDKSNLIIDAALDGETGKRNLNIVLHGFRLKKEGQ
jgi:hypothetical protein